MAADGKAGTTTVELEANEVAVIIGEEGPNMTVRVMAARDLPDQAEDVPPAHEIAVALAMRLLNDPDFHDDVLEWYYSRAGDEDDEEAEEDEEPRRR